MNSKPLAQFWKEQAPFFQPVVPFSKGLDRLGQLDLSSANTGLTEDIYSDVGRFGNYISNELARSGTRYLAGGYGELRKIYVVSDLFSGTEPRRLHLGLDIWGPEYTPVYAPAGGVIHSTAWNEGQGDYGGTVILRHETGGFTWHTLYGHLSAASVRGKNVGKPLMAGDLVGELGIPAENGYWPPHLHFQVIIDMQGFKGDYPGVCRYSERANYLENCPDPAFVAGLGL